MRSVIEYAVRHRVTVLMVCVAAVLFGVVSLQRMPVQLLPEVSYPTLTVQTTLDDAAPSEVENLVTRPLEEAVGVVPGLRRLSSVSRAGHSEIVLEFGWGTDMDFAALDVREKMDLVDLPEDADTPVLLRFDPALDPVVRLGLHGGDNLIALRHVAESVVKKDLESVAGVAAAKVLGGLQEEIHVELDEQRLAQLGVDVAEVVRIVGAENVNAAGGRLRDRDSQFLVRTLNEYTGPEDVAATVVMRDEGRVVRLGDVARVERAWKEREIVSRMDGRPAVEVAIHKEGDTNLVEVAQRVRAAAARVESDLPDGMELVVLGDQSTFVQAAVRQVQSNAMLGGVLAVLVLLVFLRDLRSTAIIAVSIPTSIVATFLLLHRQGVTLNVMSLGGLALGVGMLVDNSIVVLESIVRHRRRGGDRATAVVDGTHEVAQAVTASTLTTIAVFLPIFFVEGIARQIFQDQALTVTFALLVSLAVALTLTPMLAALGGRAKQVVGAPAASPAVGAMPVSPDPEPGRARRVYTRLLDGALRHRFVVLVSAVLLFAGAVTGLRSLGADLIPPFAQGELRFALELPEGTPIEHTDTVVARIEAAVAGVDGVDRVFGNVGLDAGTSGSARDRRENHAELNVHLAPEVGSEGEAAVAAAIRERLEDFEAVRATLQRPTSFSLRAPVAVEIYGYDLQELARASDLVVEAMEGIDGLRDVESSLQAGTPEVRVEFDRDKLRAAGLDLRAVTSGLRSKILGRVATDYEERDRQIDVLVRSEGAQRLDLDQLNTLVVGHADGRAVPLGSVASIRMDRGPAEIERIAQTRAVTVSGDLVGRDLASVGADLETVLATLPVDAGVTLEVAGQNDEMQSSLGSLQFAIALAVFLVYLVMASQFESLLDPFLILFTVPLALIGVTAALVITSTPVSVVVMIGGVMLAGIVVNNGIVLVDLVGQLRRRGLAVREAVLEAGATRLRPILMTTTTTVLGLVPLALGRGEGAELGAPLAVTVIGGLLVSTLLTLLVIPVLYGTVHGLRAERS
jgi:HAE1 family hydrophobic/amphiphilic exporter-1